MEMTAAMADVRFGRGWMRPALYGLIAVLTLIFQIYIRSSQCAPDCTLSYAKAVAWASIWPASWIVYLAGIV